MTHTTPSTVRIQLSNLAGCETLSKTAMSQTQGGLSFAFAWRRQLQFAAVRTSYGTLWAARYRYRYAYVIR